MLSATKTNPILSYECNVRWSLKLKHIVRDINSHIDILVRSNEFLSIARQTKGREQTTYTWIY